MWTLSRFQLQAGREHLIDASTEEVLLSIPKRQDEHNGGAHCLDRTACCMSGSATTMMCLPKNAQDPFSLLGKFLRIDVDSRPLPGMKYVIPKDNPFDAAVAAPEIWALGFRNPWRFGFDSQTGERFGPEMSVPPHLKRSIWSRKEKLRLGPARRKSLCRWRANDRCWL